MKLGINGRRKTALMIQMTATVILSHSLRGVAPMPRNSRGSHEAMMTTLRTAKMISNLSIQSGWTASAVPDLCLPSG